MNTNLKRAYTNGSLPFHKLLLRSLLLLPIFAILSVAMVFLCSAIFYNTDNPLGGADIASIIALYSATAISSIVLTRINKEKWLLGGLFLGVMIYLATLFLAIFVKDEVNKQNILLRVLVPIISVAFAFLSRKRTPKKHIHKPKRRI